MGWHGVEGESPLHADAEADAAVLSNGLPTFNPLRCSRLDHMYVSKLQSQFSNAHRALQRKLLGVLRRCCDASEQWLRVQSPAARRAATRTGSSAHNP